MQRQLRTLAEHGAGTQPRVGPGSSLSIQPTTARRCHRHSRRQQWHKRTLPHQRPPNTEQHAPRPKPEPGTHRTGGHKNQKKLADKSSSIPFKKVYKSSPSGGPPREPVTRGPLDPPRSTPSHTRTPQHIVIKNNRTALAIPKPLVF